MSQRSDRGRARVADVLPPHDVPFWRHAEALECIAALDTSTLRPEVRGEWEANVERLERGERFEGRAFCAPFFFDGLPSMLRHLPPDALILVSEAREVEQVADELHLQAQESYAQQLMQREIVADFPRPYLLWEELRAEAAGRAADRPQ